MYLNGKIALGCNDLLNSKKPFFINIRCLEIFIPPDDDPDDAPDDDPDDDPDGHPDNPEAGQNS